MKNKYERNILLNYVYGFTISLDLTQGIWMLYLAFRGLSLFQLGMLEGIFHVTSFLMEMPTGIIADLFGRKWSRFLGICMKFIYIVVILCANSFWLYAIGFIICALSYNLESGAGEALVYDSLVKLKKEDEFMKVSGKIEFAYQIASIAALCIGGWIGRSDYKTVYIISGIITIFALMQVVLFKEPQVRNDQNEKKISIKEAIKNQYRHSIQVMNTTPRLTYLIIFISLMGTFYTLSFYYLQNNWKQIGYNEFYIGVFLAFSSVFGAVGGIFTHKIEKKMKESGILKYLPIVMVVCLWGLSFSEHNYLFFIVMGMVDSIICVALSDYINKMIPSDKRATLISFQSMIFSFCMICLFPIFGKMADWFGMKEAFSSLALISTIFAVINMKVEYINANNDKIIVQSK
jgi:MFS family permease